MTVSGLSGQGTVTLSLVPGAITDLAGNAAVLQEQDSHAVSGTTQPTTIEVSTTPSGLLSTGTGPSASASGRLVAFTTLNADALTTGPATDGVANVVVRDTLLGKTTLLSLDLDGFAANGASGGASLSADGTEIAFVSDATNLVDVPTTAGEANVYVAKLTEGATGPQVHSITLISEGAGAQGEGVNEDGSEAFDAPILSADGFTVAFDSTQALVKGADGSATSQNTPILTGTAEAGATVTLYDSLSPTPGTAVGTATADADDVYAVSPSSALINGKHELNVTAARHHQRRGRCRQHQPAGADHRRDRHGRA